MALTIKSAKVVSVLESGSTPTLYVDYIVRTPIASATTFQALAGMTDSTPAAETTYIATCLARLTPG